jgi:hypothetical protein
MYGIYWFYKTWRDINNYTDANFSPGWRTFGLFIPFYNLIRIDGMFRHDIELLRARVGGEKFIKSPFLYGFVYVFLAAINPFWWLSFISVMPLAVVQGYLNSYWKKGQPELPERKTLSKGEIALIIIFGIWWTLALIGLTVPE